MLPSVALTRRFLALCQHYGSEPLVVRIVASGRNTGAPGLPESDDWTTWDAHEMRVAVDYLERKRGVRSGHDAETGAANVSSTRVGRRRRAFWP